MITTRKDILFESYTSFNNIGPFGGIRFEILKDIPKYANGYRVRPLSNANENNEDFDPLWVDSFGVEWFVPDPSPSEETAESVIVNFFGGPSEAEILQKAKSDLKARATHRRWEVETSGVTVGGVIVETNDRAKILLAQADREARRNPETYHVRWKGAGGTWTELDAETINYIADHVSAFVASCFQHEGDLHDLIDGSTSIEDIEDLKPIVESFDLSID